MSGFTKGPWISGIMGTSESEHEICYVRSEECSPVEVMMGSPDICMCVGEDNARLIAGAPRMLDELRSVLAAIDKHLISIAYVLDIDPSRRDLIAASAAVEAVIAEVEGIPS